MRLDKARHFVRQLDEADRASLARYSQISAGTGNIYHVAVIVGQSYWRLDGQDCLDLRDILLGDAPLGRVSAQVRAVAAALNLRIMSRTSSVSPEERAERAERRRQDQIDQGQQMLLD